MHDDEPVTIHVTSDDRPIPLCLRCGQPGVFSIRSRVCNSCRAAREAARYRADPEPIKARVQERMAREYDRVRAAATEASRRYRDRKRDEVRTRSRVRNEAFRADPANLPILQARQQVRNALARGDLVRPDRCDHCGKDGRIEAAHRDYGHALDIAWLCQSCHRRWDARDPKTRRGAQHDQT